MSIGRFESDVDEIWDTALVGRHMREVREAKQISVTEMADICGVSPARIYLCESGHQDPSLGLIAKFCHALRIHPRELFA